MCVFVEIYWVDGLQLPPGANFKLAIRAKKMPLNRLFGEEQGARDLGISVSLGSKFDDAALARGECLRARQRQPARPSPAKA